MAVSIKTASKPNTSNGSTCMIATLDLHIDGSLRPMSRHLFGAIHELEAHESGQDNEDYGVFCATWIGLTGGVNRAHRELSGQPWARSLYY